MGINSSTFFSVHVYVYMYFLGDRGDMDRLELGTTKCWETVRVEIQVIIQNLYKKKEA